MGDRIQVEAFRGLATFPLRVAIESGRTAAHGLDVQLAFTASSDDLMLGLIEGRSHVVQAAPDNVIAWRNRTGSPIAAWYGGSSGPLSLVLGPETPSIETLRGGSVAVDFPDTGWAPIMLRILADHGITRSEVEQVPMGATAKVFAAITEGRAPAGMLNEPWATRAATLGCTVAADHRSVAPRLTTSAGASLRPWLAAHRETAVAMLRSIVGATTWILDPVKRDSVIIALAEHLGASAAEASVLYAGQVDPARGWPPSAYLDPGGIEALIELRASTGQFASGPAADYLFADVYVDMFDRR